MFVMNKFGQYKAEVRKLWKLTAAFLLTFFVFSLPFYAQKEEPKQKAPADQVNNTCSQCRRRLRAVLYPFIPAKTEFFTQVERLFETQNPNIDLEIVDLSENYYNTKKPKNIVDANADIYEIDSVFLYDFVKSMKIQELPAELAPADGEVLENARRGAQIDGKWYGSPHWVCGNFLFSAADDASFQSIKTLTDLEKIIGPSPVAGRGILIDLKGSSTLGELYPDAAYDSFVSQDKVAPHLEKYNSAIESDLRRARLLCSDGFCRSDRYHETTGFYARQFARRRARALIGYSESLFFTLSEAQQSCVGGDKGDNCLTDAGIAVTELPLSSRGSQPISWVDSLTIDGKCGGQCREDAARFIRFLTSDEMYLEAVMPKYMQP